MLLGDFIQRALTYCGITEDRVKRMAGNCNCRQRKEWLNRLHAWARTVVSGMLRGSMTRELAQKHWDAVMGEYEGKD